MNNIDTIMYLIDWNRSLSEQKQGLSMAREVNCLKAFFQPSGPGYCKSVWENCAKIICEHSDSDLIPYITDMLLWLQDINWPGAELISNRLKLFEETTVLAIIIEGMVPALVALDESSWLMSISELLESSKLREKLKNETIQVLSEVQV